jgi:uncharacterized membrane protein
MSESGEHSAAHDLELRLGNVLRAGVMLAAAVVVLGGVVYLVRHGHEPPAYQKFQGEPADLRSLGGILRDSGQLRGRGIIQLGLLLLIATPIARVVFAGYGFARQRDWLYVAVAAIVLSLLSYALLSGA